METAPEPRALAELVRRRLGVAAARPVAVEEVSAHANLNHVFRVALDDRTLYVKVALPTSKRGGFPMPPSRILYEAEVLKTYAPLAGGAILTPDVLFVDEERFVLGMSDVGEGRRVLLDVLDDEYETHTAMARTFGRGLGALHGLSRGRAAFRPPVLDEAIRVLVFEGLLAPGARAVVPECWDQVRGEMLGHPECLVHLDLWAKNLLVKAGAAPALVDFEGVSVGDPAFDLGTVLAVFLIPVLRDPSHAGYEEFVRTLLGEHARASGDPEWSRAAAARAFRYVGIFLAARGFGPFPYPMSEPVRAQLAQVAGRLTREAPTEIEPYLAMVRPVARAA